jgi:LPS-assembly protein
VMRPNISFNYKPNLSRKHYYDLQVDNTGRMAQVSVFEGNLYPGYSNLRFGGLSFGVDNTLEMKWRSRKDTGRNAVRKVRLIDGFGFNSSYNFLEDSFQLLPFNIYLRSTLFDKINLTASANLDPYQVNRFGERINRLMFQDGGLGRITNASLALSTQFRSKPRDPSKSPQTQGPVTPQINDPALLGDQQRLMDYMRRNPAEFVDFNIPFDVGIDLSLNYFRQRKPDYSGFINDLKASLNFRNSFSLTPKWNFSTNGYFDLDTKKLQTFTMSINREMHCWQMSIGITPVGQYSYFSISINPKSSILQDLRVNRTRFFSNF